IVLAAGASATSRSPAVVAPAASAWEIGPLIRGKNYSAGMPLHPNPFDSGWYFDFPHPDASAGHVHYVTFKPDSLRNASQIVVRYRIDAAPGVQFIPQEHPDRPATVSVYLQRKGDTWS